MKLNVCQAGKSKLLQLSSKPLGTSMVGGCNAGSGLWSGCYRVPCPDLIRVLNVSEIVAGFQGLNVEDCTRIIIIVTGQGVMVLK